MFNKIVICILFLLINSTLEYTPIKLEKYGTQKCTEQTIFYLSLDGFKSGDTLYFEGSYTDAVIYDKIPLYFLETDNYEYFKTSDFTEVFSNSQSTIGGAHVIYYLSYTLKGNNKYLLIGTPNFPHYVNFTLEHTKSNNTIWIIIAIVAVIVIAIIIIVVCRLRRKSAMM